MSDVFGALGIAGSGVDAMQTWIDTTGGNIANANDAVPVNQRTYAEETTILSPQSVGAGQPGTGVSAGVQLGSNAGVIAYEPHSPMANAQGLVRVPNVSLSTELVNLIQAQNGYQADTSVLQKAVAAYQAGLTIGS
ncbi:MAG: flagellar basal-body rod protein FlgC [Actinomycetota bacterium]|nr:flagellar basal-body rod protein FlgC [Actinomycetota bacterium]MDA8286491.1 flagellar basal-body rod protein FlgC [Actinomycetota bacterium]